MSNKILRSIKFPQLPDTYNVPELIPEYSSDEHWRYSSICSYDGKTYLCRYLPETEYDDDYITGPFDSSYWIEIPFPLTTMVQLIANGYLEQYDPNNSYNIGDFVSSPNLLFAYCIKSTPYPAGQFNEDYWLTFDSFIPSIPHMFTVLNSATQFSNFMHATDIGRAEEFDPNFDIMKIGSDGYETQADEFEFATLSMSIEEGYDYLFSIRVDSNIKFFLTYGDIYSYPIINPFFDTSGDWQSFLYRDYSIDFLAGIDDGSKGDYYYFRVPSFITALDGITRLKIAVSCDEKVYESGEYQQHTFPIDSEELDNILSRLVCLRIKSSGDIDTTEVNKLIQQDYTEVYKNLSQDIIEEDKDGYTSSVKIPLNEGNIALQFINYDNAWNDIDVEIRLYNDSLGGQEFLTLKNSDKHIYIIDKNVGQNGELIGWDYFKLKFKSNDDYLTQDQKDFVNRTLNILRKPKTQSNPNPVFKNNPQAVQEFIEVARSFKKAQNLYVINQPTYLQEAVYYPLEQYNIDASTFIVSCLKGLQFDNTPYSANWTIPWYKYSNTWPEEHMVE